MTLRERVVREARRWVDTPYVHGQGVFGEGVDCIYLLLRVYQAVGLIPADVRPPPYSRRWFLVREDSRYRGGLERFAAEVPAADVAPGDIAGFRVGRALAHGAIVTAWPTVIHAQAGACVREVPVHAVEGSLLGVWRMRGLA